MGQSTSFYSASPSISPECGSTAPNTKSPSGGFSDPLSRSHSIINATKCFGSTNAANAAQACLGLLLAHDLINTLRRCSSRSLPPNHVNCWPRRSACRQPNGFTISRSRALAAPPSPSHNLVRPFTTATATTRRSNIYQPPASLPNLHPPVRRRQEQRQLQGKCRRAGRIDAEDRAVARAGCAGRAAEGEREACPEGEDAGAGSRYGVDRSWDFVLGA